MITVVAGLTVLAGALSPASAADGVALSILDPVDAADPKGDVRQVSVTSIGPSLVFSMQVEEYTDPELDPAWVQGRTSAYWYVDTSGDDHPELVVTVWTEAGGGYKATVYSYDSGYHMCVATPGTSAADKSYSATVDAPGCLGDVKRPAVSGSFFYHLGSTYVGDQAPNEGFGAPVRFDRPPPGQPTGGYVVVRRGAGFQRFGAALPSATPAGTFDRPTGGRPVVAVATGRSFGAYLWAVTDGGAVLTKDSGFWWGDAAGSPLAQPIVGMAKLAHGSGYWLVARDGGVFSYGAARFYGSTGGVPLNQPIVGIAATPTERGYWLVAADGGIFAFGDARFYGSTGGVHLNQRVVGMAPGLQGQGYWLVAADGGIFAYGMPFYGSTGSVTLQQPIVGMATTRSGAGYRFVARDGGVFAFGDAEFHGSASAPGRTDVVGLATI